MDLFKIKCCTFRGLRMRLGRGTQFKKCFIKLTWQVIKEWGTWKYIRGEMVVGLQLEVFFRGWGGRHSIGHFRIKIILDHLVQNLVCFQAYQNLCGLMKSCCFRNHRHFILEKFTIRAFGKPFMFIWLPVLMQNQYFLVEIKTAE